MTHFAGLLKDYRQALAVLCCSLLLRGPSPLRAQGEDVTSIEISVVSGDNRVNDTDSAWEIAVEVHDNQKRPVSGAVVVFQVQPGYGEFAGVGGNMLTLVTDAQGRAVATGFRRKQAGAFIVTVSASYHRLTASAIVHQTNPKLSFMAAHPHAKWYIGGTAAAAVGLGLGIWASQRNTTSPTTIGLGPGTVTVASH